MHDHNRQERSDLTTRDLLEFHDEDASFFEMERDFKGTRPERRAFYRQFRRPRAPKIQKKGKK